MKDTNTVVKLVESEFGRKDIQIQKVAQFGASKQNTSKSRLLLVEFYDITTKRLVLKLATTLRKCSNWSNIFISPDLTPRERSQNKTFKDELKEKRSAGEKDMYTILNVAKLFAEMLMLSHQLLHLSENLMPPLLH